MAFRVFLDSGVIMAAAIGEHRLRECALAILSEPNLEFWYSPLVKLEATLQPTYNKKTLELEFLSAYFNAANCFGNLNDTFSIAAPDAGKHGISVVDALHIAAAKLAKCSVLITTERPTSPMLRTELLPVVTIYSYQNASSSNIRKLLSIA